MLCTSKYCSSLAIGLSLIFGVVLFVFIAVAVVRLSVVETKEVADQNTLLSEELSKTQTELNLLKAEKAEVEESSTTSATTSDSTVSAVEEKTGSEITTVDSTWNLYTNYDLGFSMKIPTKMAIAGISEMTLSDVVVFEEEDYVYITSKDYYDSGIKKVLTLDIYKANESTRSGIYIRGWKINKWSVSDDDALLAKAQAEMQTTTCSLAKILVSGTDWYSVKLTSDNSADLDEGCFINGNYGLYYSSGTSSAVYWGIGQDYSFFNDGELYDMDMKDSFQFLSQ